ncbi:MAG: hypothetical protein ACYDAA_07100 [Syntrophales bacterium]
MEKDRPRKETRRRFDLIVLERPAAESEGRYVPYADFAKKEAENKAMKEEITRLEMELAEAKRQVGGFHGDILMASVVDALLHQAKSLSTIVFERERDNGPLAS